MTVPVSEREAAPVEGHPSPIPAVPSVDEAPSPGDVAWPHRHLLDVDALSWDEIELVMRTADAMREVLARGGRHARAGHLFFLDLDGFKAVNDRFGHAAGDAVLTQLAQRIVALLRAGDVAARLGGDEFAVLCDDTEPQHAVSIAERLRMAAAEPFVVDGSTIRLSAAVGCCETDHTDPTALLREADRRMYEGKRRRVRSVSRFG